MTDRHRAAAVKGAAAMSTASEQPGAVPVAQDPREPVGLLMRDLR